MANTLNLGDGNWGVKDSSLLGYAKDNTKFVPETFDVTRASSGTRVNKDGFIDTPAEIGSELITNGDFATDSNFSKGTGWSISDGKAIATNVPNLQRLQNISGVSVIGNTYKYSINISNVSGFYSVYIFGTYVVATSNIEGIIEGEFTASSANGAFWIAGASAGGLVSATIDNVSVKEYNDENLARIDYTDGVDGVLLTEPQSTNLITDSEDFSDSSWTKIRTLVTPNSVTSPSGSVNASTLSVVGATGGEELIRVQSLDSNDATCSFYVKKGNWRYITIRSVNLSVFDFDTETFTLIGTDETLSFDKLNDGWYRLKASSPTRNYCSIGFAANATTPSAGVGVDGTNVYIWGTQLEQLPHATSYIPTYGAIASRSGDVVTNAGDVNNFNSEEGVLFVETAALDTSIQQFITIGNGTDADRVSLYFYGTNLTGYAKLQGAVQCNIVHAIDYTQNHKIAFKYAENDFALWIDGVKVGIDISGNTSLPNTLNTLTMSYYNGGNPFYGKTKNIQVFNEALTDAELQTLTTI